MGKKHFINHCKGAHHIKLSIIACMFTIKSNYGLNEASYDRIIEWARSILLEGKRLKKNLYDAKSMIKNLSLGC